MTPKTQHKYAFSLNDPEKALAEKLEKRHGLSIGILAKRLLMHEAERTGVKPDVKRK